MKTSLTSPPLKFGAGQSIRRKEDARLVTGGGRFTDDAQMPDALHAVFVRSPHAHADILTMNTAAACAMPGVVAVFTGADLVAAGVRPLASAQMPLLKRLDGRPAASAPRRALAQNRVRCVGEAVAMVVARSAAVARDGAEAIAVAYRPLPAVVGASEAMAEGAPLLDEDCARNVTAVYRHGDASAVAAAIARAAAVVSISVHNNRVIANALEPRAAVASWDGADGRLTLQIGCQGAPMARLHLAEALGLPKDMVRVIVGDVGGGFGMKMWIYPEYVAVAAAARMLGRSVRWRAERTGSFLTDTQGRDQTMTADLALDAEGRMLALKVRTAANVGAYLSYLGAVIPTIAGCKIATGAYAIPAIDLEVRCVLTNTVPVDAYRGAGRPECNFLLERLVEAAARQTGIDALTLRRRNMIPPSALPYRTPMGQVYDSGNFAHLLDRALERADWNGFEDRRSKSTQRGSLRGRGVSFYIESTGANNPTEQAQLNVRDGRIELLSGTQAMGQGLDTAYSQIVAAALGISIDQVDVIQGDTDRVPTGGGSGGSRSLFVGGSAVAGAVQELIETARALAARHLEAAPMDIVLDAGRLVVAGTDRGIDLFELAELQSDRRLSVTTKVTVDGMSWPSGAHVCEVEIDRDTGVVRVDRFTAVDDVGRVLNPLLVHGQAHGGIAQGIGQALIEACAYDRASGQLLSGSLIDYALPRAGDLCDFVVETDETAPCRTNPLGAKGAGECGAVGAPPAVVAAVVDALRPFGCNEIAMPITSETVWRIMRGTA